MATLDILICSFSQIDRRMTVPEIGSDLCSGPTFLGVTVLTEAPALTGLMVSVTTWLPEPRVDPTVQQQRDANLAFHGRKHETYRYLRTHRLCKPLLDVWS